MLNGGSILEKSVVTTLVSTFHDILQLMENGLDVSLLCFEIHKAFDSVPHLPLLQKLKDIGLNQHILQWIASYLCNRRQYVVVDGASSTTILLWCPASRWAQS